MPNYKYILVRGDKFLLRLPAVCERPAESYAELPDAIRERNAALRYHNLTVPQDYEPWTGEHTTERALAESVPLIEGVTLSVQDEIAKVWEQVKNDQRPVFEKHERRQRQRIEIPTDGRPVAVAIMSDLHLGSSGTDYEAALADAQTVRATDGMYASFHGDGIDNWIIGKLAGLQRYQAVSFRKELALFVDWLGLLQDKFLWVVPGNHDNWTEKLSGIDVVASALRGCKALYDPNEVVFDLVIGSAHHLVKVRHKWRYGSIYNSTHGIEVGFDRGDTPFDIGIGGHTHIATVCRPFWRHETERWAVLTGAYKRLDKFGEELGFASTKGSGGAAMLFWPDGRKLFIPDIKTAAAFLTFERERSGVAAAL